MRPLTEQETKILFEKLANYTTDLKPLIAPLSDAVDADRYVFRLIKDRVRHFLEVWVATSIRLDIMWLTHKRIVATSVARDNLASVGICLGKTFLPGNLVSVTRQTDESRLSLNRKIHKDTEVQVTYHGFANFGRVGTSSRSVFVAANGVMPFLYGSHVSKAHVGRWTEDCPANVGVIVYDMADNAIGFMGENNITKESANLYYYRSRRLDPTGTVVFRQADCGEYLRDEDTLFAS
ncbi:hypothetical protein RRF57_003519 [Xylaria bambusicola]|uniref:Uncharacterized protein n=1 Tax=Xylaria bambusicola TaxID=326684 RepID=A0AAN7UEW6_9PEZI